MGSTVKTLCGQTFGASKYEMLGIYLQRLTILLMLTGLPLTVIYIFSKPILMLFGQSSTIASAAATYVYGLNPQNFAYAANFPIQKFLQSQRIVAPTAYISIATLLVHLLLSWVVVYKIGLGLFGASMVLSLSWWIIVLAQFIYITKSERCKHTWTGFTLEAFSGLPKFFKLCLETRYVFTSGETVANAVSELCPFLAINPIPYEIQPVLSGVAVGCGWQKFVAYVNVGCYYIVGIPLGTLLGFQFKDGAKVEKVKKRLDKWEVKDVITTPENV
ncbi:hypothetical protein NE237_009574 [Protea cynaroides]|uniref:Uncharacterized protein n=1 Tax=Protea cynaroides TaxID=273540 RepID=A0A9Q0R0S2_9MAGN|nr:hypothetical protein NE237_009574 [Protea cynaroides]